jgi:diamine N-acetyltransferase
LSAPTELTRHRRGDVRRRVSLHPVSRANVRTVCELTLADDQHGLVAPASYTVAEGQFEPGAVLRAICLDDEPVGVLLVTVEGPIPYLVRFLVGAKHQRRGIGRRAVDLLADELRQAGWRALETSFVPVAGGAEGFWRRCGFEDTGRRIGAEPLFVLGL